MRQSSKISCPICQGLTGGKCQSGIARSGSDFIAYHCTACGNFELGRLAIEDYFSAGQPPLTKIQRASLSHAVRRTASSNKIPVIMKTWLSEFLQSARLPTPLQQATNLIRAIGDYISENGEAFPAKKSSTCALVGAANLNLFENFMASMEQSGLIAEIAPAFEEDEEFIQDQYSTYDLTFHGWERYEAEKRGHVVGNYGFIAMKFNDLNLENLVKNVIKPEVKRGTGYDVLDVREQSRAGVIDNILREQIRDAAFIIADLSHDNNGAYWEAGYAEGLGKPVIYICEQKKFEVTKTHFDTNHCTTVMWRSDDTDIFAQQLVATIRRSLKTVPAI